MTKVREMSKLFFFAIIPELKTYKKITFKYFVTILNSPQDIVKNKIYDKGTRKRETFFFLIFLNPKINEKIYVSIFCNHN